MFLDLSGQAEVKAGAGWRVGGGPQAATMRFNDGAADGQTHTSAVRLGSKERVKNLVCLLPGQPDAGIADGDQQLLLLELTAR